MRGDQCCCRFHALAELIGLKKHIAKPLSYPQIPLYSQRHQHHHHRHHHQHHHRPDLTPTQHRLHRHRYHHHHYHHQQHVHRHHHAAPHPKKLLRKKKCFCRGEAPTFILPSDYVVTSPPARARPLFPKAIARRVRRQGRTCCYPRCPRQNLSARRCRSCWGDQPGREIRTAHSKTNATEKSPPKQCHKKNATQRPPPKNATEKMMPPKKKSAKKDPRKTSPKSATENATEKRHRTTPPSYTEKRHEKNVTEQTDEGVGDSRISTA